MSKSVTKEESASDLYASLPAMATEAPVVPRSVDALRTHPGYNLNIETQIAVAGKTVDVPVVNKDGKEVGKLSVKTA